MPAIHNMICSACGLVQMDIPLSSEGQHCRGCKKGRMEILWQAARQHDAVVHKSERTTLYYSPKEKKWQYPATNDKPVPDRLRKRGYERVEFSSLHSLEQHEKQANVRSEQVWFDRGSGRSFDDE